MGAGRCESGLLGPIPLPTPLGPIPQGHCSVWSDGLSIRQPQCKGLSFLMRYMSYPGTIKTALLWQNVLCCMFVLWCLSVTPVVPETPVICWSLTAITCSKSPPATQPAWWHPRSFLCHPQSTKCLSRPQGSRLAWNQTQLARMANFSNHLCYWGYLLCARCLNALLFCPTTPRFRLSIFI